MILAHIESSNRSKRTNKEWETKFDIQKKLPAAEVDFAAGLKTACDFLQQEKAC